MQSKIIPTDSTTATIRYVLEPKIGAEERAEDRVAQVYAQHSGIATAAGDFLDLRQEYDQQGKVRRGKGRYYEPDDPDEATHLKVGKNWRAARPGETPTHVRVAPEDEVVLCNEGYHMVYSFARHEVNPDDPQQTAEAFRFIQESLTEMYPGEQMLMVGQTDAEGSPEANERGEGGKFHVHVVVNAVLAEGMEVDGERFRAGQRLRGTLTDIDDLRRRMDERLNERHHEYGLPPQMLASVGSAAYERGKSDPASYWARRKGLLSDQDKVKEGVDLALEHLAETRSADLAGMDRSDRMQAFDEALATVTDGDVSVSLRELKSGEMKLRSFRVAGRARPLAHKTLGPWYGDARIQDQLEQVAQGTWERMPAHQDLTHLPDREIGELSGIERQEMTAALQALAERHRTVTPTTPAPSVSTYDRVPAALEDLWAEMAADDTPERVDELDRVIRSGGPVPRVGQPGKAEGDELVPAPRRRRQRPADEREEQVPTTPTVAEEPVEAPEPAPRPVVAPEVAQGAPESSEGQQKPAPRAYTTPRPEKPAQPAAEAPKGHEHKKIDGLFGVDRRGLELIARQSGEQPRFVDFQLRAGTDVAYGHHGLSLNQWKTPEGKHGYVKIPERMLEQLEQAAGDNRVEVLGGNVLGVRADVIYNDKHKLWLPRRFQESRLEPVTPDILDQQRQAERDAREQGLVSSSRRKSWANQRRLEQGPEVTRDHDRGYGLGD